MDFIFFPYDDCSNDWIAFIKLRAFIIVVDIFFVPDIPRIIMIVTMQSLFFFSFHHSTAIIFFHFPEIYRRIVYYISRRNENRIRAHFISALRRLNQHKSRLKESEDWKYLKFWITFWITAHSGYKRSNFSTHNQFSSSLRLLHFATSLHSFFLFPYPVFEKHFDPPPPPLPSPGTQRTWFFIVGTWEDIV